MWDYLSTMRDAHKKWDKTITPTVLSAYRRTADSCNKRKLSEIKSALKVYHSCDSITVPSPEELMNYRGEEKQLNKEFDSFIADQQLHLKVGAQVILIKNVSQKKQLVNGSRGVVVKFIETFDELLQFETELPVVKFACGKSYVMGYHKFCTSGDSDLEIERMQIPLKLGWALTIHKSQGMTLDRVILDLPVAFAPGHAYVAMSRVKDPSGLSIRNFTSDSVYVSGKVLDFYKDLENANKE
jgi:ATP-dependent DNA helicase PIF1